MFGVNAWTCTTIANTETAWGNGTFDEKLITRQIRSRDILRKKKNQKYIPNEIDFLALNVVVYSYAISVRHEY